MEDNTKTPKTNKEAVKDREKKNQIYKRYNKETLVSGIVIGAARLGASTYISFCSDENTGVEFAEKAWKVHLNSFIKKTDQYKKKNAYKKFQKKRQMKSAICI